MPAECGNLGCTKFDTDTVFGGPGSDTIDYSSRSDNVKIALDGSQKSGGWMENDSLTGLENAVGGSGDDEIYGNDAANSLIGGGGRRRDRRAGRQRLPQRRLGRRLPRRRREQRLRDRRRRRRSAGRRRRQRHAGSGSGGDAVSYFWADSGVVAHIGTGTGRPAGELDKIADDVEDLGRGLRRQALRQRRRQRADRVQRSDLLIGNGGIDTLKGDEGGDPSTRAATRCRTSPPAARHDVANADKLDGVSADCEGSRPQGLTAHAALPYRLGVHIADTEAVRSA